MKSPLSTDDRQTDAAWAARLESIRRGVGLRLDASGGWWQQDSPFEHPGLVAALNRGIALHPETREPIVYIGDKWCYFDSEDLPFIIHGYEYASDGLWADLNTGARELIPRDGLFQDGERVLVRLDEHRVARMTRTAQSRMAEVLDEDNGRLCLRFGSDLYFIGDAPT